jgi:hypothetical protein
MSRLKTFSIPADSQGSIVAIAVNMLESMPSVELPVTRSSYIGSGVTGSRDVFMMLPDEIYLKSGHSVWSIELTIDGTLVDTQVFEINNVADMGTLRDAVSKDMNLSIVRALIDGKAVPVSETETHVFNSDGIIIQKISVIDGARTSAFSGHSLVWIGAEATFDTTAILDYDLEGNQVWVRELTQEGVL